MIKEVKGQKSKVKKFNPKPDIPKFIMFFDF
jgi:hypothetical protein